MHITRSLILVAAVAALPVHAQTLSPAWTEYRERQQSDAAAPATPAAHTDAGSDMTAPAPAPAQSTAAAPASGAHATPIAHVAEPAPSAPAEVAARGAFFVAAQVGQAWIYDDLRQDSRSISAGYRWQAGPAVQVGIEAVGGRIDGASISDRDRVGSTDYASLGANARFQFGGSPLFAMTRLGYWRADADSGYGSETVDGGYAGVGLGVDFNRHVNLTLAYSYHAYASSYYYRAGSYSVSGTTINRADVVTLGLEARF